ncbi:fused MFS/spermidine synthase [bacterium]|nr:fused MFS/spermidine synthase [bacterium]
MRAALGLVVFLGATTMGFQMLGPRLMAAHFGSVPQVWAAVISVFLGGLAIGYSIGGRLGDRQSGRRWAVGIWALTSLLVVVTHRIAGPVGEWFVAQAAIPPWWEPVAGATVLFLLPTIGMGTALPLLLRLGFRGKVGEGEHAGRYLSFSTLGGILGVLGTMFWLLPRFPLGTVALILAAPWAVAAAVAAASRSAAEGGGG